jgi:uncharacterized membrane protein
MNRPKIKIQPTKIEWVLELIGLLGIIFTVVITVTSYNDLPDSIPRHFNALGQPDGFSRKPILFILSAVTLVTYLIMTIGLKFPHVFNYPLEITEENAERQYRNATLMMRVIKTIIVVMFGYLTYATIQIGLGEMQGLGTWIIPTMLTLVLGTVGYFVHRTFRLQ